MSDMILAVTPATRSAPSQALSDLVPIVPTARRDFMRADRVIAFARVYQPKAFAPLPAAIHASVRNASDTVVFRQTAQLDRGDFDASGAADYRVDLPPAGLVPGEYLLTIEAAQGMFVIERQVRFRVR